MGFWKKVSELFREDQKPNHFITNLEFKRLNAIVQGAVKGEQHTEIFECMQEESHDFIKFLYLNPKNIEKGGTYQDAANVWITLKLADLQLQINESKKAGSKLNLDELRQDVSDALNGQTQESLTEWLDAKRSQPPTGLPKWFRYNLFKGHSKIKAINDRNNEIFKMHHKHRMTNDELAKMFGVGHSVINKVIEMGNKRLNELTHGSTKSKA